MRIHISTGPIRKKPRAGDERVIKGVLMIRQQKKHCGMYMVNNGRPVWEWVEKGGPDDRSAGGGVL